MNETASISSPTRKGTRTRNRILNAAEIRFLALGYNGASVRDIATEAGVDQGLISYYFKTKSDLFREVLDRRLVDAFARQQLALETLKQHCAPANPGVEAILNAYTETMLKPLMDGDPGLGAIIRLSIPRSKPNAQQYLFEPIQKLYTPVRANYIRALQLALPSLDKEDITWGFEAFEAVYTSALTDPSGRQPGPTRRQIRQARRNLVRYSAAGFAGIGNAT
jgi:AcrR family transcriptional regulator